MIDDYKYLNLYYILVILNDRINNVSSENLVELFQDRVLLIACKTSYLLVFVTEVPECAFADKNVEYTSPARPQRSPPPPDIPSPRPISS